MSTSILAKRKLIHKLAVIQEQMDISNTIFLASHKMELCHKLEEVLNREEILWKQNAKCDWLHLRDRNINFFHARALQRRKNNSIIAICNLVGDWIFDSEAIELEATNFFQKLYGVDLGLMRNLPSHRFPKLESLDLDFLGRLVTDEEIKIALFHMASLKAPGDDEFHALLF